MIPTISVVFDTPPDYPDRRNGSAVFNVDAAAYAAWNVEDAANRIIFKTELNALVESVNLVAAGLNQLEPTEAFDFGKTYDFPDVVAAPDGETYRATEEIGYESDIGPVGFTNVLSSATSNSYILKQITTTSHANKTFVFKIKGASRWTEVGSWSIRIYDGSFQGTATAIEHNRAYGTHSGTHTFGASPAANILVLLERVGGSGNDDYALYSAYLYESTDPNTNLLTGDGLWQTDFTGWTNTNTTDSVVAASGRWHNLTGETKIISFNSSSPTSDVAITTGEKAVFLVPASMNGWQLVAISGCVTTPSSSGTSTMKLTNKTTGHDMTSTSVTIDSGEYSSETAATQPVINTAYKTVATGNRLMSNITTVGTGAKGHTLTATFRKP